jgi:hypothetical protein
LDTGELLFEPTWKLLHLANPWCEVRAKFTRGKHWDLDGLGAYEGAVRRRREIKVVRSGDSGSWRLGHRGRLGARPRDIQNVEVPACPADASPRGGEIVPGRDVGQDVVHATANTTSQGDQEFHLIVVRDVATPAADDVRRSLELEDKRSPCTLRHRIEALKSLLSLGECPPRRAVTAPPKLGAEIHLHGALRKPDVPVRPWRRRHDSED